MKRYSGHIPLISLAGDFFLLNLLFVAGFYLRLGPQEGFEQISYLTFFAYLNFTWMILLLVFGADRVDRNTTRKRILFLYIRITVFFFFLFLLYFQATPLAYYPRDDIKYLFVSFFLLLIGWKFALYYTFYLLRKKGYNLRSVVILGHSADGEELSRYFRANVWHGYHFLGFFGERKDPAHHVIASWKELPQYLADHQVDEIYLALHCIPVEAMEIVNGVIAEYPVQVRILPQLAGFSFKSAELIAYGQVQILQIHPGPLSYWYNLLIKRTADVIVSLIMILGALSWMVPLLFILDRLGAREGIFFIQRRTGINNHVFPCIKFRTMHPNPEADEIQAVRGDHRITRVGAFLRKTSLDELPQFLNVLIGQMSVIGPRPHMLKHTNEYRSLVQRFMVRHTVKPGITGLAQVQGFRGEIKHPDDLRRRVAADVFYVENWSFSLDLRIMFLTVKVLMTGQREAC